MPGPPWDRVPTQTAPGAGAQSEAGRVWDCCKPSPPAPLRSPPAGAAPWGPPAAPWGPLWGPRAVQWARCLCCGRCVCVCVCECTRVGRVPARSRAGDVTPARGAAPPRRGFGKHLALGHGLHNGTRGPCQHRAAHGQVTPAPAGWERGSQEPPCSSQSAASPQGAEGGAGFSSAQPLAASPKALGPQHLSLVW